MAKHGPIETVMADIPGNPNERKGGAGVYDGEPGLPKRTGGELPEKTYETEGEFGKVKRD